MTINPKTAKKNLDFFWNSYFELDTVKYDKRSNLVFWLTVKGLYLYQNEVKRWIFLFFELYKEVKGNPPGLKNERKFRMTSIEEKMMYENNLYGACLLRAGVTVWETV